jgi:hypothetical protein
VISEIVFILYFLIGFVFSRVGIVRKHNLILDDSGVHTVFMTVFWLPGMCGAVVLYAFKLIAKFIDPVIRKF